MGNFPSVALFPLHAEDLLTDLIGVYKQLSQEDTQDIVTS